MKKWIFVVIILLLSVSGAFADSSKGYSFDGNGIPEYPNSGVLWSKVWESYPPSSSGGTFSSEYDNGGHLIYYQAYGCIDAYNSNHVNSGGNGWCGVESDKDVLYLSSFNFYDSFFNSSDKSGSTTNVIKASSHAGSGEGAGMTTTTYISVYVSPYPLINYTLSGDTCGVTSVDVYLVSGTDNILIYKKTLSGEDSYSTKIVKNATYLVSFSNGHQYQFTCNGDEVYNYDTCQHCTINIYDNCANLLNEAYTVIYDIDKNVNVIYSGYDNSINLTSNDINTSDELRVIWSTWLGTVQKTCYAQFDHDINLYDQLVYWNMDVYVYDNESNPVKGANVDFNQDCVINGYPARNKYTDYNGLAEFTQCENKDANLVVSKDGYQTLSTSISGGWYDAYTNTYEISVILQQSNTSIWDLINNSVNDTNATEEPQDVLDANGTPINVDLYFKDCNGQYTTQINDSDPYVRCYYDVIAMKPVSMTLKFQKSMSGYWFSDVYTYPYTINNNSYGYMNLSNDNFSDPDYMYRAYISDPSYPEYDRYVYLSVVNQTEQSETHYENLSGYCMFANTNNNGSIDYREEIKGYAYVVSDNASLRTVSLELYDNSTLIDYVNLTNSSFDDDIYVWELGYTYILGHNYSLVLKGYDGSILDVDNVITYNIVGNKLIIKVTDAFNHNLDHVYIYVEHYGSINTGWLNYGTFEGLPNGETRYKATKSGYRSGVWKSVNLTNENEVVTYQLIQEAPIGSVASVRLSDSDVKDIYYPFMYFLLIIILIGALMNVIN